jgi:hypothetical protein
MSSIYDKQELIRKLTHICDEVDSSFMTWNKAKLGSNVASFAASGVGKIKSLRKAYLKIKIRLINI